MSLQLLTAKQLSGFQKLLTEHELQLKYTPDDTIQTRLKLYAYTKTIADLKERLKSLATIISEDQSNLGDQIKQTILLVESDLKAHWQRIQGSFLCYTRSPKDPLNTLCLNIAKALYPLPASETERDKLPSGEGPYFLIMPSLEADKDMIGTNIHNYELHQIVLSDDQTLFIPIAPCLERTGLSNDGLFTQQAAKAADLVPQTNEQGKIINPNPFLNPLSEQEKDRIIHHSQESEIYYQHIKALLEERETNTSLGAALERLQADLFKGSTRGTTAGKGAEMNAGSDANEGIIKFAKKWNEISEQQRNAWCAKYPGEEQNTLDSGFGKMVKPGLKELIDRIVRSEKLSYTAVRYCVQLTAADLKTFITNYKDQLFTEPFSAKAVSTDLQIFVKRVSQADEVFKKAIAQSEYVVKSGNHFGRLPVFLLSETITEQEKFLANKAISNAFLLAISHIKSIDMPFFMTVFQEFPQTLKQKVIESRFPNGQTPLAYTASHGPSEVIKIILAAGANINADDINRYTALHYAITNGQIESMRVLLAHNPDLTLRTTNGDNVLDLALHPSHNQVAAPLIPELCVKIFNSSKEVQKDILKRIANGQYTDILSWAFDHHPATLSALFALPNAAELIITLKARYGNNVLFEAIKRKHQQPVIKALIKSGLDVNMDDDENNTPLIASAQHNNLEAMRVLLAENADMTLSNDEDETVWQVAKKGSPAFLTELSTKIFNCTEEIQKKVLNSSKYSTIWEWSFDHNPNVFSALFTLNPADLLNKLILRYGKSALIHTIFRKHNHPQLIQALATRPEIDINFHEPHFETALTYAIYHNHGVTTRFLLAKNADITVISINGYNALEIAIGYAPNLIPQICIKLFQQPKEVQKKILAKQANGQYDDIFVWAFDRHLASADALLELPDAPLKEMASKIKAVHKQNALNLAVHYGYNFLIPYLDTTDVLNNRHNNPLFTAISDKSEAAVSAVLALHPDLSIKNNQGKNAFAMAVDTDISILSLLLKHIAFRPREEQKKLLLGISLFKAIDLNFKSLIQILIDLEVGLNDKLGEDTTLIHAINKKNWPVAEHLFAKADLDDRNKQGKNALDLIHKENPALVTPLLIKIAERCSHRQQREILKYIENGRYKTVLEYAKVAHPDIVAIVSAYPNTQKISDNQLQLITASKKGDRGSIHSLIAAGADINSQDLDDENTPLMWTVIHNHTPIIPIFLNDNDVDLILRNKKGSNILDLALIRKPQLIPQLLTKSAQHLTEEQQQEFLKQVDSGRYKTIIAYAKAKHPELVTDLLLLPNVIKTVDKMNRQLMAATKKGLYAEVQQLVISQGANVNIQDESHNTLSTIAARQGNKPIIQFLLSQKANTTMRNNNGESVLTFSGYADLLQEAGLTSLTDDFAAANRYLERLGYTRRITEMEEKKMELDVQYGITGGERYYLAIYEIDQLVAKLEKAKIAFLRKSNRPGPLMDASNVNEFKTTCIQALRQARTTLSEHRDFLSCIADFLWTIMTLGLNKCWNFFPLKTDSRKKLDAFEASFEQQSLSAPAA